MNHKFKGMYQEYMENIRILGYEQLRMQELAA